MFANTHPPFDEPPPSYLAAATMPQPTSSSHAEPQSAPPGSAKQDFMSFASPPTPAQQHLTSLPSTVHDPASPERALSTTPLIEHTQRPPPLHALSPIPIPTIFPTTLPPRPAPVRHPWNLRFCTNPRPTIAPRPQEMETGVLPQRHVLLHDRSHRGVGTLPRGRGLLASSVQYEGDESRVRRMRKWRWIIGTATMVVGFWMLIVIGIKYGGRNDVNRNLEG
jgi:hypothetical protein